jgi:hypothetical protein
MFWGATKRYTRKHCTYSFKDLERIVPEALRTTLLSSMRKFARKSFRYMDIYRSGRQLTPKQIERGMKLTLNKTFYFFQEYEGFSVTELFKKNWTPIQSWRFKVTTVHRRVDRATNKEISMQIKMSLSTSSVKVAGFSSSRLKSDF